ncbi:hypothetical protein JH06_1978 [Blastocystis sp. subtype 4]|uniref:hypothetical protein n=1 Tax=Blastocystis sp. subtype 4 TaxID=944170 RepID=UPI000711BEBE|nr:hypothetical protein JH06_1978 [Blastocystis sp. subtype 4]KNB44323.1 hypothetical protein JH06_1978 [Blastocystis sp. subtype 4]|eukprot:XP_014527766.1 hypothetical protein JH06_1978 [Blastocystis sp. subtype 4]
MRRLLEYNPEKRISVYIEVNIYSTLGLVKLQFHKIVDLCPHFLLEKEDCYILMFVRKVNYFRHMQNSIHTSKYS